jgi:NADPH:quinone reductase-like Zn-dependent oxidoreductase
MRESERLCGGPSRTLEFPLTLGRDFAGEVVECGLGVRGIRPGDKVWGVTSPQHQGSHAQFVVATTDTVSINIIV